MQRFYKNTSLVFFLIFLVLFLIVFRSLIFNLSTNLLDTRDYALMLWIVFQNISKIQSLQLQNYFNTTAFYPHPYSLLFSDLLLPQSLLALPFYVFSKNLILSFNLVFILTYVLNYISTYIFWKKLFKNNILAFLGSILFVFSPFFHLELGHFQMMSYWPFFFSLYFLFQTEEEKKYLNSVLTGVFLSIQFLASVYLAVYLLTVIGIYYLFKVFSKKTFKKVLTSVVIVMVIFLLFCGVFIKGYFDMKKTYNFKRNIEEYITYSASLSDYVFTSSINSVIHSSPLIQKWNSANKNVWGGHASFPGFLLFFFGIGGLFFWNKDKKTITLSLKLDKQKGFFLTLILVGFIFSLGPRMTFNGTYAHIPLPYSIALKIVPIFESIRVSSRWSFLFYLGFIFFALVGLNKIMNKKYIKTILIIFFVFFILEYIPFNIKTEAENYIDDRDKILKNLCTNNKQVLLELPVTHLDAENNIADGLSYITRVQLASTYHNCYLVNGYSGYDLPDIFDLEQKLNQDISSNNTSQFLSELKSRNINVIKFNPDDFMPSQQNNLSHFLTTLDGEKNIQKADTTIYVIPHQ